MALRKSLNSQQILCWGTERLIRFSACLNRLSYFAIKLSGVLFWQQLYLVHFLVIQSSLDCIQTVGLCQGPVAGSELALSSPAVCPWNKRLQQFRQFQWKCLWCIQASLRLTPQHCIECFGSPAFFKCISQRVLRIFRFDFATGFSAKKPFPLRVSHSLSLLSLCDFFFLRTGNWVVAVSVQLQQPTDDAFIFQPLMNIESTFFVLIVCSCYFAHFLFSSKWANVRKLRSVILCFTWNNTATDYISL